MRQSLKRFLVVGALILVFAPAIFAGGSKEKAPPAITIGGEETFLSPNSSPGVKDSVVIPMKIVADKDNKMVIKEYRLTITDASGKTVREWANKDQTEPGFFARLFISLGFMDKPSVEVPASITWDGKDASGAFVPDGTYTYVLEAWDDSGVAAKSAPAKVTVDNTPPSAEVKFAYRIFSPDGDGRMDVLPVEAKSSAEKLWKVAVKDTTGKDVAASEFRGGLPGAFDWDGTDKDGRRLPDGEYVVTISCEDEAGNRFTTTTDPVTIDTKPRAFAIGTDYRAFSPNGDGVKDAVTLTAANFVPDGFKGAVLEILDESGAVKLSWRFEGSLPSSMTFDGRDPSGGILPEGNYRARMRVDYANGALVEATSDPVSLDLTPPSIKVTADTRYFSPDGDGSKDSVQLTQDCSPAPVWKGTITSSNGSVVRSVEWKDRPDATVAWDGTDDKGGKLPDGDYSYVLTGTDEAGNTASSPAISLVIDTQPVTLSVGIGFEAFSPNGDGVKDTVAIDPVLNVGKETEAYVLTVKNEAGDVVRTVRENKAVPTPLVWDGKNDNGTILPDGSYSASLEVTYVNGSRARAASKVFVIDTKFPEAEVKADKLRIQPELGDAEKGIAFTQTSSEEDLWTGEIVSPAASAPIFSKTWTGKATDFTWKGEKADGSTAEDGTYGYRLVCEDRAGNRKVVEVSGIEVQRLRPTVTIVPSATAFSPNGDGLFDRITFDVDCSETRGLVGGTVEFLEDGKTPAGSISVKGGAAFPLSVQWDGKDGSGKVLPDGSYLIVLTLDYGNRKVRTEAPNRILIDTTPPEVIVRSDSLPFSPDNDGRNDHLDFSVEVKDASPVGEWSARVLDSSGAAFATFTGTGEIPSRGSWDGTSAKGDLVKSAEDYRVEYSVKDAVGNEARGTLAFPVDILVYKEGGKNKIRVANIQFAPYTTEYLKWNAEVGKTNAATLDSVAAMLKKFPAYRIRLEGHAVSVLYKDAKAAAGEQKWVLLPLSRSRAEIVKKALVQRGIQASRIDIDGFGAEFPLAPFSDLAKRWINRRVEFILLRE